MQRRRFFQRLSTLVCLAATTRLTRCSASVFRARHAAMVACAGGSSVHAAGVVLASFTSRLGQWLTGADCAGICGIAASVWRIGIDDAGVLTNCGRASHLGAKTGLVDRSGCTERLTVASGRRPTTLTGKGLQSSAVHS